MLNQRVRTKGITSAETTGTIAGALTADCFLAMHTPNLDVKSWDDNFPGWKSKNIYYVMLDQPGYNTQYEKHLGRMYYCSSTGEPLTLVEQDDEYCWEDEKGKRHPIKKQKIITFAEDELEFVCF